MLGLREAMLGPVHGCACSVLCPQSAINNGLPVIELAEGTDAMQTGDEAGVNFSAGTAEHDRKTYSFPRLPPEVLAILEDGGLIPHVKKVLAAQVR